MGGELRPVAIAEIKSIIRSYRAWPWGVIWRDYLGVHYRRSPWETIKIVGDVKWMRYKWWR